MNANNSIAIFDSKKIRKLWHEEDWWFVISEAISVLTDSKNPYDYLKKLSKKDESLAIIFKEEGQIVPSHRFEFETAGGR